MDRVTAIKPADGWASRISPASLAALERLRSAIEDPFVERKLPWWPDGARGVPNLVLRSALFGLHSKNQPRFHAERVEVPCQRGATIIYSGKQLDQGDFDVWMAVLHAARHQALGGECRVTAYRLLMILGLTDTGRNRDILAGRLDRLVSGRVDILMDGGSFSGGLISSLTRNPVAVGYVISLSPNLIILYDQYTRINWAVRRALRGQQLAQWLHGYYASHAQPYPLRLATMSRLCGSRITRPDNFRRELRNKLTLLNKANEKFGCETFDWVVDSNLCSIQKNVNKYRCQ